MGSEKPKEAGGIGVTGFWKKDHPRVSIIIVNFNGGALLRKAVRAALGSDVPVEVFVSDNGSIDESLAALQDLRRDPRLRVIENHNNLGFSRANNVALKHSTGEFVLLLNPDCVIRPDTLRRMLTAMERFPEAVMAGCLIRNSDGTEQAGCRRRMPTPWRTLVRVLHLNTLFPNHPRFRNITLAREPVPDQPVLLEAISGAFMLIRRTEFERVGLLDEGYFMHCEDLDLCMQFHRTNRPILFVPDVEVVHYKGTCSASRPLRVLWYKHKGMIRFYRKFFRHQYPPVLMALVIAAVLARFSLLAGMVALKKLWSPTRERDFSQGVQADDVQSASTAVPAVQSRSAVVPPMVARRECDSTEAAREANHGH